MKKIAWIAFLICLSVFSYGQHRVQISYDLPETEILSWNADSIAPYKIIDGYLQKVDVYQCPGKSKDEIYNGVFAYLANVLGNMKKYVQDKDREAGKITVSWVQPGITPTGKFLRVPYDCSHVMIVETKEGRIRITHNLHTLIYGGGYFEKPITECYPITPPRRKRPNNWEKHFPDMIRLEMAANEVLNQRILESISRENDEW